MYVHGPMTEGCVGSPGWVTKPRAASRWKGQCTTKGRDVVSSQCLSGRVGYMVGVSRCEVPSMWEALGMFIKHDNMS